MSTDALLIILTASLVAASCGLLGCFLVLRRLSMLGDAISHAILPGIVIAFLFTQRISSLPMFIGAVILGLLTSVIVQALSRGGVQGDAAMGVTFTALFAIGVVMVSSPALRNTDLDVECILYGDLLYTPLDRILVGDYDLGPKALWVAGFLLLLNSLFLALFYKQFKICAFDPGMAAAVGINVAAMHYLLMGLVSITTVGAFESVGAILVVAMLIVPGATAYLLTDRLERMLLISLGVGALSALLGYLLASRLDASIAGAMATVAGLLFALALLFSPRHGIVSRRVAQTRLRRQVAEEDVLLWAIRRTETEAAPAFTVAELSRGVERLPADAAAAANRLARSGDLRAEGGRYTLSEAGRVHATDLLRRHRVYESYLGELGYPTDHLHEAADRVEHFLSPALTAAMEAAARHPERDPQGKTIPGKSEPS